MSRQRPAAHLPGRNDDLTTIRLQHANRRVVQRCKGDSRDASSKECNARAPLAARGKSLAHTGIKKAPVDARKKLKALLHSEKTRNLRTSHERLQSSYLRKPRSARHETNSRRMRQKPAINKIARHPRRPRARIFLLDLRPRQFDQFSVFDARRARRLARAAIQAAIHVRYECVAKLQSPFINELHLPDSPARRIRLLAPQPVSRTMIEAQPTMNAAGIILVERAVDGAESTQSFLKFSLRVGNRGGGSGGHDVTILPRSGPARECCEDRKVFLIWPSAKNRRASGPKREGNSSIRVDTRVSSRAHQVPRQQP